MATANSIPHLATSSTSIDTTLLVVLATLPPEHLTLTLGTLAEAFPTESMVVASPDAFDHALPDPRLRLVATPATNASWTLTAADFLNSYQNAEEHKVRGVLVLGPECHSLSARTLQAMSHAVLTNSVDLVMPRYELPPRAGLVNSAILYPMTRALFAAPVRFPLAIDLALSLRMAERLAMAAQRFTASNQSDAIIWPVDEAAAAGFTITEIQGGSRTMPQPGTSDLNAILAQVTGSLFADVDAKASFWQRARSVTSQAESANGLHPAETPVDIAPMLESFRLAFTNLQEIWSLVLPPNSLLGLKRLAASTPSSFRMADSLWARIVYDFVLAFRLRTINRGHLLGALTPLYLAWVASHFQLTQSGIDPERHIESVAEAFEADKPYLVSRWRWPDRFNP